MGRTKSYKKSWPRKNLGALVNFLEEQHPEGINLYVVADKLGITEQAVSYIFVKDDMKLSRAQEIAAAYGYSIMLYFPEKTYPEGIIPPPMKYKFENAGQLSGLVKYISDCNYSIGFVSKMIGMNPQMILTAFKKGEIFISNLYSIVNALGINVIWKFYKINDTEK